MKTKWSLIPIVLLLALSIVSCGTDGESYVKVPFGTGENAFFMGILDTDRYNGIYVDTQNWQLYCKENNTIIKLPSNAVEDSVTKNPFIEINVIVICNMGQKNFDIFIELFEPSTESEK